MEFTLLCELRHEREALLKHCLWKAFHGRIQISRRRFPLPALSTNSCQNGERVPPLLKRELKQKGLITATCCLWSWYLARSCEEYWSSYFLTVLYACKCLWKSQLLVIRISLVAPIILLTNKLAYVSVLQSNSAKAEKKSSTLSMISDVSLPSLSIIPLMTDGLL